MDITTIFKPEFIVGDFIFPGPHFLGNAVTLFIMFSIGIRIKEELSKHISHGEEIDMSCPGGIGRNNLLILNEDIYEENLVISNNDTIIGGPGDQFVGKVW